MAKTKAELVADITTDIADAGAALPNNANHLISPTGVRQQILDLDARLLDQLARENQPNGYVGTDANGRSLADGLFTHPNLPSALPRPNINRGSEFASPFDIITNAEDQDAILNGGGAGVDATAALKELAENVRRIEFPGGGTYQITDSINCFDKTKLYGHGARIMCVDAGWNMSGLDHYGIFNIRNVGEIEITGFDIYGTKSQDAGHSPKLIYFGNCHDVWIHHNTLQHQQFEGIWQADAADGSINLWVTDNRVKNVGYPAAAYRGLPAIQYNGIDSICSRNQLSDVGMGIGISGRGSLICDNIVRGITELGISSGDGLQPVAQSVQGNFVELTSWATSARKAFAFGGGEPRDVGLSPTSVKGNRVRILGTLGHQMPRGFSTETLEQGDFTENVVEIDTLGMGFEFLGTVPGTLISVNRNKVFVKNEGVAAACKGFSGTPNFAGQSLTIVSSMNEVFGITRAKSGFAYDYREVAGATLSAVLTDDYTTEGQIRIGGMNYNSGECDNRRFRVSNATTGHQDIVQSIYPLMLSVGPGLPTRVIASGVISIAGFQASLLLRRTRVTVDTESGATDDLDTINGGEDGDIIIVSTAVSTRDVTVKNGTGNLKTNGDCVLGTVNDRIVLMYDGANWCELSRNLPGYVFPTTQKTTLVGADKFAINDGADKYVLASAIAPYLTAQEEALANGRTLSVQPTVGFALLEPELSNLFTISRGTTKTYFDAAGLLQVAPVDSWPLDHDPASLEPLGRKVEGARTNVVLQRRDLSNAAWTKTNITAAKDQVGIDGVTNSASSILATAGNGTCLQAITLASSARSQTAWVKRLVGTGVVNMTMDNGSTWTAITVTSAWTRVSIPTQTLANPTVGFRLVANADKIAVDFVQNENGTFASSTIPDTTAGSSVTRNADDIQITGSNFSGFFNGTEGTIVIESQVIDDANATDGTVHFDKGDTNDFIYIKNREMRVTTGSVQQANIGDNFTRTVDRQAGRYKANDISLAKNGVLFTPDTSAALPTGLTIMRVGSTPTGYGYNWWRRVDYYNTGRTDADLLELTLGDVLIIAEGDSRVDGASYASATNYALPTGVTGASKVAGISGSVLADVVARAPAQDAQVRSGHLFIYTGPLIGANDLATYPGASDAAAAAAYWLVLKALLEARVAAEFVVIPITELPTGTAAHNTRRNIINPLIRAWGASRWGCIDFAADPTMGPDNAFSLDATLWNDATHPSDLGHAHLGPIYTTVVNAVIATLL